MPSSRNMEAKKSSKTFGRKKQKTPQRKVKSKGFNENGIKKILEVFPRRGTEEREQKYRKNCGAIQVMHRLKKGLTMRCSSWKSVVRKTRQNASPSKTRQTLLKASRKTTTGVSRDASKEASEALRVEI